MCRSQHSSVSRLTSLTASCFCFNFPTCVALTVGHKLPPLLSLSLSPHVVMHVRFHPVNLYDASWETSKETRLKMWDIWCHLTMAFVSSCESTTESQMRFGASLSTEWENLLRYWSNVHSALTSYLFAPWEWNVEKMKRNVLLCRLVNGTRF